MREYAPPSATSREATILLSELERQLEGWLLDCEIRQHSPRTIHNRRQAVEKLLWWMRLHRYARCGLPQLRAFLAYVTRGHEQDGGRWGDERLTKPVKPGTVASYYRILRTLFGWIVQEGVLPASPMDAIRPPVDRADQVQPFTADQVNALLDQAARTGSPERDTAILLLLLDTGCRAEELCALNMCDVDLTGMTLRVKGKGKKQRTLPFGRRTKRALALYLRTLSGQRHDEAPLFFGVRGHTPGAALTRSGLRDLITRLRDAGKLTGARYSPHTFRHTFAVEFLRAGGNAFTLQELLGHETQEMVARYVKLAQADIEAQHRRFSPGDRLKRR